MYFMFSANAAVSSHGDTAMTDMRLLDAVGPWIEDHLNVPMSSAAEGGTAVVAWSTDKPQAPLRALLAGGKSIVALHPQWVDGVRRIIDDLPPDLLYSTFGAYELTRVTLPDGVGVWGPSWYLFADKDSPRPTKDERVVEISPAALAGIDFSLYWHCQADSLAGFAVYEGDRMVGLATVWDHGGDVWEVGMDVLADARGGGLGRAIVSAGVEWILDSGHIAMASTAAFNVPSARTLRASGLRYVFSSLHGTEGIMNLPPQPLGLPFKGATVHNLYPEWAMNKDIQPRRGS